MLKADMNPFHWPKLIAVCLIRWYQLVISPLHSPCCRFSPTCSEYGRQAIDRFGLLYGGWLTLKRICRCHPFYKGNYYDPVPEQKQKLRKNCEIR